MSKYGAGRRNRQCIPLTTPKNHIWPRAPFGIKKNKEVL